ncbi:MAG: DUF1289 domain-containing protein [Chromatiales bacterium]|nr:MAG: DUF1289 domain-containing protein [Chromatiales bacterium]
MSAKPDAASPCTNVCVMNEQSGYCQGCWRTLEEIAGWGRFSDARKAAILQQLHTRRRDEREQPVPSLLYPER